MSLNKTDTVIKLFYQLDKEDIRRSDLLFKDFSEISFPLQLIKSKIKTLIDHYSQFDERNLYAGEIISAIDKFNQIVINTKVYDLATNKPERSTIISSAKSWIETIELELDRKSGRGFGFNTLYDRAIMHTLYEFKDQNKDLLEEKKEFITLKSEVSTLLKQLQNAAASKTAENYANIFKYQSKSHSNFRRKDENGNWRFNFGSAQIWLLVSTTLIIGFFITIFQLHNLFKIDEHGSTTGATFTYITRLLFLSLIIYIISFCIKQYNVQKHLSTLNKHRENTLNSFDLFLKSIDKTDFVTRNALMMEVAKAIYESGQTGYIIGKDGDSIPSIIEMTKFIGNKGAP